jgi:hypothetical protein
VTVDNYIFDKKIFLSFIVASVPMAFLGGYIPINPKYFKLIAGIFLSPIIILANWTSVKNASGVAALFILCNSLAGLSGHLVALNKVDSNIIYWIIAVIIGGLIGSHLGTVKFNNKIIIACLFLVLLTAGLKFLLIDFA